MKLLPYLVTLVFQDCIWSWNRGVTIMKQFLVIFFLTIGSLVHAASIVPKPPSVNASAWILKDFDSGRVLAEYDSEVRLEPASLTKMMTAYVVFGELSEGSIGLEDEVVVSKKAWQMPGSRMFIEVGKKVSVADLLKGVIIQSGNDASVALAEYVAGDEQTFAALMNQYAQKLGMAGTNYTNSTGLPEESHYTTANDLSLLARALIRDFPAFYKWHAIKSFEFNEISQKNRNGLLWRDDSVDGIKTGHTSSAGYCLVVSALRNNMRLISVVLGSKSVKARNQDTQALLNFGFRFYDTYKIYDAGKTLKTVRVWKGSKNIFPIGLKEDMYITIPKGQYNNVEATLDIREMIEAPVTSGETYGSVQLKLGEREVASNPVVALESVDIGGVWARTLDSIGLWFK